jgi:lysophospholipase L1-like esterase
MKTFNIKSLIAIALVACVIVSCKQEVITLTPPPGPEAPTGSKGNADFTKYVAIGNSLTAGFQAGALFTEGQNNSFPLILSKQFSIAQGTTLAFNQPDINSVNGYNSSYSNPGASVIRGRMILFAADNVQAHALPTPAATPGVPAPYNTADLPTPYTGDKTKLNNFGVPGILLAQALIPQTGGPSTGNPYYNGLYGRFASNPGTSTIIGDALGTQPTFFTFDLGNNDVLGYATNGGDNAGIQMTDQISFGTYYQNAIGAFMTNSQAKGVVTTIPYVTTIPFFLTVKYNPIPLDAATASYVTTNLANNYNAFLAGMKQAGVISDGELAKRTLKYSAGQNAILISDETLTDLSPYMAGPYAALLPYKLARQTTSADLVPLTAGGIIGTLANPNDPTTVYGVAVPLGDKYILLPSEQTAIKNAIDGYNATIKSIAASASFSSRIAVADVNAAFSDFMVQYATKGGIFEDNVLMQPTFAPPNGVFSEDGVHPNSRGYAYLANIIIDAINAKFSANVPKASLGAYSAAGFPYGPGGIIPF